jgi:hypothetical protein
MRVLALAAWVLASSAASLRSLPELCSELGVADKYLEILEASGVTVHSLRTIEDERLRELGIPIGPRVRLMNAHKPGCCADAVGAEDVGQLRGQPADEQEQPPPSPPQQKKKTKKKKRKPPSVGSAATAPSAGSAAPPQPAGLSEFEVDPQQAGSNPSSSGGAARPPASGAAGASPVVVSAGACDSAFMHQWAAGVGIALHPRYPPSLLFVLLL